MTDSPQVIGELSAPQRDELFAYADGLLDRLSRWPGCPVTLGQFSDMLAAKEREIVGRDKP